MDPTDECVRWYLASHRCGPVDTEWHISDAVADGRQAESPAAIAAWMRSVSRYLGTRPPEQFTNSTVWPAVRELAETLDDLFPTALPSGRGR